MKGASPRTAKLLTRPTFRNWFRPEYPYVYAGFRLVELNNGDD
jgi:formylglycine-generating enzyme required for sulfatase activity